MSAVILGNNPETCNHIYPVTRDGRCHGCGATHPTHRNGENRTMESQELAALNPRHLSLDTEHFTPLAVVEAARKAMGEIDLDPATSEVGNRERVHAKSIYTARDNGFQKTWQGRVFLNPPGGKCDGSGVSLFSTPPTKGKDAGGSGARWTCDPSRIPCGHDHRSSSQSSQKVWWHKLVRSWEEGTVTSAVFVGFSIEILQTTQVKLVGRIPLEFPICVPKNRIAYDREIRSDGSVRYETGDSPPHASVLVFLPPVDQIGATLDTHDAIARFHEAFSPIGHVIIPWEWR